MSFVNEKTACLPKKITALPPGVVVVGETSRNLPHDVGFGYHFGCRFLKGPFYKVRDRSEATRRYMIMFWLTPLK